MWDTITISTPVSAIEDFERLIAPTGFIFASAEPTFRANFCRDAAEAALDLLPTGFLPENISKRIILSIAELQGMETNLTSEEEPGRAHHEYRNAQQIEGESVSAESKEILKILGPKFGGDEHAMTYYGSADATQLYVKLIGAHCRTFGKDILTTSYINKKSQPSTIKESLYKALTYLETQLTHSKSGFFEFQTTNPYSIETKSHANQTWKDSPTSLIDTEGNLPNYDAPIAVIAIQGLTYDALQVGIELFAKENSTDAARWTLLAAQLQQQLLDQFWMPDEQYFAVAFDYDREQKMRQIKTCTSDAGILLNTQIFDSLEESERLKYIVPTIKKLMSSEFLTDAGIRCRALSTPDPEFWDYHGRLASWPKETYDIACGMHRQGFSSCAKQLENRLLNAVNIAGCHAELFYVADDGTVIYNPRSKGTRVAPAEKIAEVTQAWTISAAIAIKIRNGATKANTSEETLTTIHAENIKNPTQNNMFNKIEQDILTNIPHIEILDTAEAIKKATPADTYTIDVVEALRLKTAFLKKDY
ncbi:hypothetical protein BH09PAT2_BH09PAT2_05290 [soil metagenome]